jgi:hypothetical protein
MWMSPVVLGTSLALLAFGSGRAAAEPSPPPPPPIIGPLQLGPPAYPPTVGVPLIPQARSGVVASADTLDPSAAQAATPDGGIAGVTTSSGAITPVPLPPA